MNDDGLELCVDDCMLMTDILNTCCETHGILLFVCSHTINEMHNQCSQNTNHILVIVIYTTQIRS